MSTCKVIQHCINVDSVVGKLYRRKEKIPQATGARIQEKMSQIPEISLKQE